MNKKRGRNLAKPSPFGRILTQVMAQRELGIREVAQLAGVGPSTVMSWKTGATPSDLLAVRRLAEALRIDFCYLLTGERDPYAIPNDAPSRNPNGDPDYEFEGYARVIIQRIDPGH